MRNGSIMECLFYAVRNISLLNYVRRASNYTTAFVGMLFTLYFLILIIKKEEWLTQNSLGGCICFWNWRKNMLILVSLKSTIGLTTVFSILLTEADFRCPGPICCDGQTIVFLQHFFSTFHHPFIVDTNSFQTRSHPRAYVFVKRVVYFRFYQPEFTLNLLYVLLLYWGEP